MDENHQLLSSGSPRHIPRTRNNHRKPLPVTKLALKKYFRRSSIFEQAHKTKHHDITIITIESSTSESSHTGDKSPVVISDSEEERAQKPRPPIKKQTGKAVERVRKVANVQPPYLSHAKYCDVEKWVSHVNSAKGNMSHFDDISIISNASNPAFKSPNTNMAVNSTFAESGPKKRLDEMFSSRQTFKSYDKSCSTNQNHTNGSRINTSNNKKSSINSDVRKICKIDRLLSPIENISSSIKSAQEGMGSHKSSTKSMKSLVQGVGKINLAQDHDSDEDAVRLLDEVYGTEWHANKDKILSSSKPKAKPTKSENRPKPSVEDNPLKFIQKRLFDKQVPSPWRERFKGICDSDTESSEDENDRKCTPNNQPLKKPAPTKTIPKVDAKITKATSRINVELKDLGLERLNLQKTCTFLESLSSTVPLEQCDYSARIYRTTFAKNKQKLATKLFALYNDKIFDRAIPADTAIEWNKRMTATAGLCHCKKKIKNGIVTEREVKITLSDKVITAADRLRDTLVHEMCHAATYIVNEVSDGHGIFWKEWAKKAMNTFPELPPIKRCHQYEINMKYTYKCTGCSYSIARHRNTINIETKRCGYCRGKFEIFINKPNKKNGEIQSVPSTPKREPKGFALYVKENYAQVKTPQLKHGDVMRKLGEQYQDSRKNGT